MCPMHAPVARRAAPGRQIASETTCGLAARRPRPYPGRLPTRQARQTMRPIAHPQPLGWTAECVETLRLAGPLALANLLQMLTYAIDVIFIARLGAQELAASALAVAVFGVLVVGAVRPDRRGLPHRRRRTGRARRPALRPIRRTVRMALWIAGPARRAGDARLHAGRANHAGRPGRTRISPRWPAPTWRSCCSRPCRC